ncbi:helix-turn-helix domain-containing protein [Kribbella sp. NPDC051587]|uniref:helix-turn-helix domain-containing protein n=1 Tax=Kribbella sp. NPDC051587 TaxID=3364119 RepID=UPI00379DF620
MYDEKVRIEAREAMARGESLSAIGKRLGVSRSTLRDWRDNADREPRSSGCPRCTEQPMSAEYAHLLGWYLGDGCLSEHRRQVYALRIACDDKYPRLTDEVAAVIAAVHPTRPVHRTQAIGYTSVVSYWKHWPCLFPQQGSGPKHLRRIELAAWQQEIVAAQPELFVRGLFNSDGCRAANWATRSVGGVVKRYEYPRYQFSNESADIMGLCQEALTRLGVPWRMPRRNALSVARREGVARLDELVGPKA